MSKKESIHPPSEANNMLSLDLGEEKFFPANLRGVIRRKYLKLKMKKLPGPVKDRLVVLKNMQAKELEYYAEFRKEVLELQKKYFKSLKPFLDMRSAIINGTVEPPKETPKFKELDEPVPSKEEKLKMQKLYGFIDNEIKAIPANAKGVPGFWLSTFKCIESLANLITNRDEEVLNKLKDVQCVYNEENSFSIEFHFDKNDYFTNTKLSKTYYIRNEVEDYKDCIWDFEGPKICKCVGCKIEWKQGKNLMHKIDTKTVLDDWDEESFFEFFDPPSLSVGERDDEIEAKLFCDYKLGLYFRDTIIPKAVLFYTGDYIEADEEEDDSSKEYESFEEEHELDE